MLHKFKCIGNTEMLSVLSLVFSCIWIKTVALLDFSVL
jgi:hypothetical protein